MAKPVIAVDLDNCLSAYNENIVTWFNSYNKDQISLEDFQHGTPQKIQDRLQDYWLSENFINQLHFVQHARKVLYALRKYYKLGVVSSRPLCIEHETREWLDRHYFGCFDELMLAESDSGEPQTKLQMCEALGASFLIDDELPPLQECSSAVSTMFLFGNYSWNRLEHQSLPENIQRVDGWTDLLRLLTDDATSRGLTQDEKPVNGPKWAKYKEDLVTISSRRSAAFYGVVVVSKFNTLPRLRLQASDDAISNAVQVAEIFKKVGDAKVVKIQTSYGKVHHQGEVHRVPRILILLDRTEKLRLRLKAQQNLLSDENP